MGNNNSQEHSKLIQLYQEYIPQKTRDEQFGECTVLVSKAKPNEKLILKEFTFTDEEIFQKNKKHFESKQKIQNPYLLKIVDIYSIQDQQMCSQFFKLYVVFEHPYSQLFTTSINPQDYWAILFGYIRALEELQQKSMIHEHIQSKTLYLPPKICQPFLFEQSTNYQLLFQNNRIKDIYLSPQQMLALRQKEFQPQHNPYKSDVFILGMCLLQAILQQPLLDCYNNQCYLIEDQLKIKIENLQVQQELKDILSLMLQIQESQRPDFIQLSQILDQKYSESLTNNLKQQLAHISLSEHSCNSSQQNSQQQTTKQSTQIIQQQQSQQIPQMKQIKCSKSNAKKPSLRDIITEPSNNNSTATSRVESLLCQSQQDICDFLDNQIIPNQKNSIISKIDENLEQSESENPTSRSQLPLQDQTEQHLNQNLQLKLSDINGKESQQQFSLPYDLPGQQPHISGFSSQGEIFVNEQYQDGSKYNGYKFNGMRHGQGVFYYKDGGYYDGNWQFNHMHGYGTLYYSNGQPAYKGSWNQDKFQGFGVLYNEIPSKLNEQFNYKDFDLIEDYWQRYEGEFNDDNKEGQGTLFLINGERFSGQFLKDYINGFGLYYTKDNKIIEGRWQNNKLVQ